MSESTIPMGQKAPTLPDTVQGVFDAFGFCLQVIFELLLGLGRVVKVRWEPWLWANFPEYLWEPRFLNPDLLRDHEWNKKTPLFLLPNELLLLVANALEREGDINSLAKTNRWFYSLLNPYLYRRNSLQFGSSALLWAAQQGRVATARTCVSEGANVDVKDSNDGTPLFWAAMNGHEAVVKLLLETGRVDVDSKDSHGLTALSGAAMQGHEAVVKLLLDTGQVDVNSKDSNDDTPLFWAAIKGNEAVTKLLLETGRVDVDSKDSHGLTALSGAATQGHEEVVKLLLDTGQVDVNSKDSDGRTPLFRAAIKGNEAVVKLLLDTGRVDVDSKGSDGSTYPGPQRMGMRRW